MQEIKPFNRATEKSFSSSGRLHMDLINRRTSFDSEACKMMSAKAQMFVHFVPIGDSWYVAVNEDNDGYRLSLITNRSGLRVSNSKFIRYFFAINKIKDSLAVFMVSPVANLEWRGVPVYMVNVIPK